MISVILKKFLLIASLFCLSNTLSLAQINVKNLRLPANSNQFSHYYHQTPHGIKLLNQYSTQTKKVTEQETEIEILGSIFGNNHLNLTDQYTDQYFEIGRFQHQDYLYKLIIYNTYGESDTPLLNILLTSYDHQGKLRAALLLDSQYSYEDVSSFNKFKINRDFTIDITQYVTYYYDDKYGYGDERGLIKNPVAKVYLKQKYQIKNGYFQLIQSKSYD